MRDLFELLLEADDTEDDVEEETKDEKPDETTTDTTDETEDTTNTEENPEEEETTTDEENPDENNLEETEDTPVDGEEENPEEVPPTKPAVDPDIESLEIKNKKEIFNKFSELNSIISFLEKRLVEYKSDIVVDRKMTKNNVTNILLSEIEATQKELEDILLNQISKVEYKILKKIYIKYIGKVEIISNIFKHLNNDVK